MYMIKFKYLKNFPDFKMRKKNQTYKHFIWYSLNLMKNNEFLIVFEGERIDYSINEI